MNYQKVKASPLLGLLGWSIVLLTILLTSFVLLSNSTTEPDIREYSNIVIGVGFIVIFVVLFVFFLGIRPILKRLIIENNNLKKFANTDPLTSLYNRRAFLIAYDRQIKMQKRGTSTHATLVMIDLDDFKRVNDNFGHDVGDDVLKGVALTVKSSVRATDIVARFGGEEFILLLPNTHLESARILSKKISNSIKLESKNYSPKSQFQYITLSIGIISLTCSDTFKESLIKVDHALYTAKKSGKNCIKTL